MAYFEDIGARQSSIHAEPNSPAFYYAEYLADLSSSSAEVSAETTVGSEGQIIVKMKDSNGTSGTVEYTDIEVSAAGVRTFTVEDRPLTERIAVKVTPTEVKGVTAARVLSYLSVSGKHYVVVTIQNATDSVLDAGGMPSFVDVNGKQVESTTFLGSFQVRPGATAVVAFEFPDGETPAGKVYIDAFINDFATPVPFVLDVVHL